MAYIGNIPAEAFSSFQKQDFTTSATTSYTLDHAVANQNELALFINFVRQEPTAAYTASGTSLTLTSATSVGDDMYCVYLGKAVQTVVPPSGSVGASQLASDAVTAAKLNDDIISGQTAETSIATDDLILLSDTSASGALRKMTRANFVSGIGGTNEAEFSVIISGSGSTSLADSTEVTIPFASEEFDPDGVFNTSTHKFTAPSAGKYFFNWTVRKSNFTANRFYIDVIKNSSGKATFENGGGSVYGSIGGSIILDLAQNDTVHGIYYQNSGGSVNISNNNTRFSGFKLIG